jgi:predicted Fe-Mo cluster-binding NifX family protein
MKIAIPVAECSGLDSLVYGHFGSAPLFVLVDSETMTVEPLGNQDQVHAHGQCQPMKAMANTIPDAVVVGGIGAGALHGLRAAGIKVYRADGNTVAEAVAMLQNGMLHEIGENEACGVHSGGHSCHH